MRLRNSHKIPHCFQSVVFSGGKQVIEPSEPCFFRRSSPDGVTTVLSVKDMGLLVEKNISVHREAGLVYPSVVAQFRADFCMGGKNFQQLIIEDFHTACQ
jgi:hypothetical protein